MKNRILGLMKIRGISVDEMVNYLEMSRTTFYRRMTDPDSLTLRELKRMAKLIGMTVTDLLERGGKT